MASSPSKNNSAPVDSQNGAEPEADKPIIIYESQRLQMISFVHTVMMLREELTLQQLFAMLYAIYGSKKCKRLFETPEELLEFVRERCTPVVQIEEQEEDGNVILRWDAALDEGKLHDAHTAVGRHVCSKMGLPNEEDDDE